MLHALVVARRSARLSDVIRVPVAEVLFLRRAVELGCRSVVSDAVLDAGDHLRLRLASRSWDVHL